MWTERHRIAWHSHLCNRSHLPSYHNTKGGLFQHFLQPPRDETLCKAVSSQRGILQKQTVHYRAFVTGCSANTPCGNASLFFPTSFAFPCALFPSISAQFHFPLGYSFQSELTVCQWDDGTCDPSLFTVTLYHLWLNLQEWRQEFYEMPLWTNNDTTVSAVQMFTVAGCRKTSWTRPSVLEQAQETLQLLWMSTNSLL